MFDAVLVINQYVMIINLASLLKSYLGQYAVHKFTLIWSKKVNIVFFYKKHFNKEFVRTKKDDKNFECYAKCWICDNAFVENDIKVRDHCHVTGKYSGAAKRDCNINITLNYKIPMFHNIKKMVHILLWKNLKKSILKLSYTRQIRKIYEL